MTSEYEEGLRLRRIVLGEEYVDQVIRDIDGFTRPFHELLTEYCWGRVWARPGLARRDRSLINIAMLVALNRPYELGLHVRGALRNGCSKEEIAEVLLQTAIYCGIPAAANGYAVATEVLREADRRGDGAEVGERVAVLETKP